jgi:hypothetical protein
MELMHVMLIASYKIQDMIHTHTDTLLLERTRDTFLIL